MTQRPAAVLFDLDDTLYQERTFVDGGFRAVARFLAPRTGARPSDLFARLVELHAAEGRGRLFDRLLAELDRDDSDLVLASVLAYRTHRPRLDLFPGVVELLDRLRGAGIRTGIVSDGHASVQRRKIAALSAVGRQVDLVLLTDELPPGYAKPSPVPFRVACRILGIDPGQAVYVANDRRKDFAGAREAGLMTIRCGLEPDEGGPRAGHGQVLEDADYVADAIVDLEPILLDAGARRARTE